VSANFLRPDVLPTSEWRVTRPESGRTLLRTGLPGRVTLPWSFVRVARDPPERWTRLNGQLPPGAETIDVKRDNAREPNGNSIKSTLLEDVMASEETDKELERIARRVESLVDDGKEEHPKYLVSALGIALGDDLKTLKRITNRGLNDFIESRLSHRFRLERTGVHRNITAVVDRSVDSATLQMPTSTREQNPRFHPRFWAAFSVPAHGDHVRVLNQDDLTFKDVPSEEAPKDVLTVPNDLIVSADENRRDEKIKANIAIWLGKNGLAANKFLASKGAGSQTFNRQTDSLLAAVIAALDHRQLQSNTLTLDAIATLLRTPRG
jgi:hypothetical protein